MKDWFFYTNLGSQKAQEFKHHNQVSALFPWLQMDRQVIVAGLIQPMSAAESAAYFLSRPRESQLAAWTSHQSRSISSRQFLDAQFQSMKSKFQKGKIPVPDFWGGFRIVPQQWEFWQGGENRLHDRFRYVKVESVDQWEIKSLGSIVRFPYPAAGDTAGVSSVTLMHLKIMPRIE